MKARYAFRTLGFSIVFASFCMGHTLSWAHTGDANSPADPSHHDGQREAPSANTDSPYREQASNAGSRLPSLSPMTAFVAALHGSSGTTSHSTDLIDHLSQQPLFDHAQEIISQLTLFRDRLAQQIQRTPEQVRQWSSTTVLSTFEGIRLSGAGTLNESLKSYFATKQDAAALTPFLQNLSQSLSAQPPENPDARNAQTLATSLVLQAVVQSSLRAQFAPEIKNRLAEEQKLQEAQEALAQPLGHVASFFQRHPYLRRGLRSIVELDNTPVGQFSSHKDSWGKAIFVVFMLITALIVLGPWLYLLLAFPAFPALPFVRFLALTTVHIAVSTYITTFLFPAKLKALDQSLLQRTRDEQTIREAAQRPAQQSIDADTYARLESLSQALSTGFKNAGLDPLLAQALVNGAVSPGATPLDLALLCQNALTKEPHAPTGIRAAPFEPTAPSPGSPTQEAPTSDADDHLEVANPTTTGRVSTP